MKSDYQIDAIDKNDCVALLRDHHYLSKISKGFKSKFNYGLVHGDQVVGVCIFTGFPVPELSVGMLGIDRDDQDGLFELSRLVLDPDHQAQEHNLASWFVARCIRQLRKETNVRVILSYADDDFHQGTVYHALGFDYYGMTAAKKDFWVRMPDGSFTKQSRGKTKGVDGEWRPRSRKHRFVKVYDNTLTVKWEN